MIKVFLESGKLSKLKIANGSRVSKGNLLATYVTDNGLMRLKAPVSGVVRDVCNPSEATDSVKCLVCCIEPTECNHFTRIKNMCADCGCDLNEDILKSAKSEKLVSMVHSIPELQISSELAAAIGADDIKNLLSQRRLVLILDLDQTLIHTTNDDVDSDLDGVIHFKLWQNAGPWYHTKFRPGVEKFLKNISKLFELQIISFGVRLYAHTMAAFLDPSGTLFHQRIMSRDEIQFFGADKTSNLSALFPHGTEMVCIVDDREDVWNYMPNVIKAPPYRYFKGTGDINSPNMPIKDPRVNQEDSDEQNKSAVEPNEAESNNSSQYEDSKNKPPSTVETSKISSDHDADDYLERLEMVLEQIHSMFFEEYDRTGKLVSVVKMMQRLKSSILENLNIVFTSVFPTNYPLEKTREFKECIALGANVSQTLQLDTACKTTHLIAAKPGTSKVNQAKRCKKIHIVNPDWLWDCSFRWEKVKEENYALEKYTSNTIKRCISPYKNMNHIPSNGHVAAEDVFLKKNLIKSLTEEIEEELKDEEYHSESSASSDESGESASKRYKTDVDVIDDDMVNDIERELLQDLN